MATSKRIIPCLDVKDGRVVKGIQFVNLVDAGDAIENVIQYEKNGADEIVLLDITASSEKRNIILDLVKRVAEKLFIPYCVGGGIRTMKDIEQILKEGADKISINTQAYLHPNILQEASQHFGSQCIVCAIDVKYNGQFYEVYLNGGRTPTGTDVLTWVKQAEEHGAGEILLTSMDNDGTKKGYDLSLLKKVVDAIHIPVIASGGAGQLQHFQEAFDVGVSAALAASLFHFKEISILHLKEYLQQQGTPVRINSPPPVID